MRSSVLALALVSGCALTSRSEPLQVRYFSADTVRERTPNAPAASASPLNLRLERVRSSSHLGQSIAYRSGAHELGYYDAVRWTERPESFLERGLERALFQERGVTRVVGGASQALSVELVAFEEVREPSPLGRAEVTITLHDERTSGLEQTIRVERPIPNTGKDEASRAVAALSEALDAAIEQIAQVVIQRLHALAATEPAPRPAAEAAVR